MVGGNDNTLVTVTGSDKRTICVEDLNLSGLIYSSLLIGCQMCFWLDVLEGI